MRLWKKRESVDDILNAAAAEITRSHKAPTPTERDKAVMKLAREIKDLHSARDPRLILIEAELLTPKNV